MSREERKLGQVFDMFGFTGEGKDRANSIRFAFLLSTVESNGQMGTPLTNPPKQQLQKMTLWSLSLSTECLLTNHNQPNKMLNFSVYPKGTCFPNPNVIIKNQEVS